MEERKTALVIGASRGLGFAIAEELLRRDWEVVGTCRAGSPHQLGGLAGKFPKTLQVETVDMTEEEEIVQLKSRLGKKTFNLLFVNAGVANANGMQETIGDVSTEEFVRVMVTNALSPMRVLEQLAGHVRRGGTMGVMSSGQGSIADNESGANDVYRASKAALNMLMKSFATRHKGENAFLLLAPGWVKTDMGGAGAKFTIEEVIPDIVDTLVSQEGKPGLRYLDRFGKTVPW